MEHWNCLEISMRTMIDWYMVKGIGARRHEQRGCARKGPNHRIGAARRLDSSTCGVA
jgi:hypothetical protein